MRQARKVKMTNVVSTVLTIVAIFSGPVTALWIQQRLDAKREHEKRKHALFNTIWSTRDFPTRLHYRHVEALNMIPIEFRDDDSVMNAWREYLDKLNSPQPAENYACEQLYKERDERFRDLILALSNSLRFRFNRLDIQKQFYSPAAHNTWAQQEATIRDGAANVLSGATPIKVVFVGPEEDPKIGADR